MTIDKSKSDSLLSESYQWLTAFDQIKVSQPLRLLIQQMQKAIDDSDYASAWLLINQLNQLADKIKGSLSAEPREPSWIRVECALAAYRLGNLPEAARLLQTSLELYDKKYGRHYEAIVKWMLGCVQWQTHDPRTNSIVSWQESIEIFQDLAQRSLDILNITRSTWYSNRMAEMNLAFALALQPAGTSPDSFADAPTSPVAGLDPETSERNASFPSNGDFMRLFRVHEEVSAGNFHPTGLNSTSFGYVDISQFEIEGRPHYLVNLRKSGKAIKLVPGKDYDVLRVSGESMTAEAIDDGDYVLLRVQETAEHNDIVAVQIHSIEPEATLKKFLIERNKFIFRFRSNHPMYKYADGRDMEFQFSGYNHEKFQIVGVAIAVFKPLHVTS